MHARTGHGGEKSARYYDSYWRSEPAEQGMSHIVYCFVLVT